MYVVHTGSLLCRFNATKSDMAARNVGKVRDWQIGHGSEERGQSERLAVRVVVFGCIPGTRPHERKFEGVWRILGPARNHVGGAIAARICPFTAHR